MSDVSDTEDEPIGSGKDGIIFLIDSTELMFVEDDSGNCAFRQCIKACDQAMMHKIKFSNLDMIGVVFFGTDKTSNDGNRSNISVLQGLQRPSAATLLELRKMHESSTLDDFRTKYGHCDDYLFADVLWITQSLLIKKNFKLTTSRAILLSCSKCFGKDDNHSQRQAKAFANDLHGNSISLDFIPCVPDYKPSEFIATIMQIVGGHSEQWAVPRPLVINSLEEIPDIVESITAARDQRSRCIGHLNFRIGEKVSMEVEIYNLVRPSAGPKKVYLHRITNENVTTKVVLQVPEPERMRFEEEEGECSLSQTPAVDTSLSEPGPVTVQRVDLDKCLTVGEEKARLSQSEFEMMKNITTPGLVLLGFIPVDLLRITHHCNPASLVYPSRSSSSGSRDLFAALWHRMGVKKVAAVCTYTLRKGCHPCFAALVPSDLEKDKEVFEDYRKHGVHTMPDPQGFHIFSFPFNDNINSLGLPSRPSASSEQVEAAVSVLKRLKFIYHPSRIPNPAIETEWAAIEALALDLKDVRPVTDEIMPDYELMDIRLGGLAKAFIESVYSEDYDPMGKVKKSRAVPKARKEPVNEMDLDIVEAAIKKRKLESLTMDKLKMYLKSKGLPVSGKKKSDLVEEIYNLRYQ